MSVDTDNWRYENAGTADDLLTNGTTLTNLPATKSKFGVAFYQTTRAKCFDLPATSEVWMKFDVYFNGSQRWRAYNSVSSSDMNGLTAQTSGGLTFFSTDLGTSSDIGFVNVCKTNTLQTVLLHMISGASDGIVEAWVDGNFIYRYTGNVNNGEDFADIYLQSDGSGTFFSNVIISNAEIGLDENIPVSVEVNFKPAVFMSWIPLGEIKLKPLIFASYIPNHEKPEKATADLFRIVTKSELTESTCADTYRKVGGAENVSADLLRQVACSEAFTADTKREVHQQENISGDTFRRVAQSDICSVDTFREVKKRETVIADTSRKIGITVADADTLRKTITGTVAVFDTCRNIGEAEIISADTYLRTARTDIARADSYRQIIATTVAGGDTLRKIGVIGDVEIFSADTCRSLGTKETTSFDTLRRGTAIDIAVGDLTRAIRAFVTADTCRKVDRKERAIARTVIRIPHVLNYILQSRPYTFKAASTGRRLAGDNPFSIVNTFKDYGVTAINITLGEKTLSDDFRFDIASRSIDINETVQGWLLDYPFHFLVEETTQTDLIQSVKGRYNVDDLLYTWFLLSLDTSIVLNPSSNDTDTETNKTDYIIPSAAAIITRIAHYFDLTPDVNIDDFTPSNFTNGSTLTYADVLNNVFGWTSRLPHRQINVFIRGGTLHCIQRGNESSVFDITDLPHSRPTVNKKFNRTLCYNPNKNNASDSNDSNDSDDSDDSDANPFSGTITYGDRNFTLSYTYSDGLLVNELSVSNTGDGLSTDDIPYHYGGDKGKVSVIARSFTTYQYVSYATTKDDTEHYLDLKITTASAVKNDGDNVTKTESDTTTNYHYKTIDNEIYLFAEYEETHTVEYDYDRDSASVSSWKKSSEETHTKETRHVPVGNGWYTQMVFLDGEPQGANLSQGAPGNRVSPYTVNQIQKKFTHSVSISELKKSIEEKDELSMIVDDSFPVKETSVKDELQSALRWLHRKIIETVNVDLITKVDNGVPSIQHIVDFTERIRFYGAEYFLVSNRITFTPRRLIQKLQLIRWY